MNWYEFREILVRSVDSAARSLIGRSMARSGANECFHVHYVFVTKQENDATTCKYMQITFEFLEFAFFPSVGVYLQTIQTTTFLRTFLRGYPSQRSRIASRPWKHPIVCPSKISLFKWGPSTTRSFSEAKDGNGPRLCRGRWKSTCGLHVGLWGVDQQADELLAWECFALFFAINSY